MIGLCHKCGFMGDSPTKITGPTKEEFEVLSKKYKVEKALRVAAEQECVRHKLYFENTRNQIADDKIIVAKLTNMMDILMAPTEAKRISTIAKIKKHLSSGLLLSSIRKANNG